MIIITSDGTENKHIAEGVGRKLGVRIFPPYFAIGFATDDKRPMAAAIFNEFNGSNIELTIWAEKGKITKGIIQTIANYVFNQLKCRRLTVRTKKRNKTVQELALRYGFTYEHVVKRYFPDDHAVVFRMYPEDCRWLKRERNASALAA